MERYRKGVRSNTDQKDKAPFKVRFTRQSIICGVIFLIVFLTGLLRTNTAQKFTERIGYTLSYTVDYKTTVMDIAKRIKEFANGR